LNREKSLKNLILNQIEIKKNKEVVFYEDDEIIKLAESLSKFEI